MVLLAGQFDLVVFCVSGALSESPFVFRIDGNTKVLHGSDFTPSAEVERHDLPKLCLVAWRWLKCKIVRTDS